MGGLAIVLILICLLLVAKVPVISSEEENSYENACPNELATPESGRYLYYNQNNGINHEFFLYMPKHYNAGIPVKLLLLFHGWGGSGDDWARKGDLVKAANEKAFVVVAPTGLNDEDYGSSEDSSSSKTSWNVQGSGTGLDPNGATICDLERQSESHCYSHSCECTNLCPWTHCGDDISFVLGLIDYLKDSLVCFNEVYALGESNGGMLVWDLGMNDESASVFSALSTVVGSPHAGYAFSKGTSNPLPIITFTGQRDSTIPPGNANQVDITDRTVSQDGSEAYYYVPTAAMVKLWSLYHGCDTSVTPPPRIGVPGTSPWPWEYTCGSYCAIYDTWPLVLDCRSKWKGHSVSYGRITPLVLDFFNAHAKTRPCGLFETKASCRAEYPRCKWTRSSCSAADASTFPATKQDISTMTGALMVVCLILGLFVIHLVRLRVKKSHRVRIDGNELLDQYNKSGLTQIG